MGGALSVSSKVEAKDMTEFRSQVFRKRKLSDATLEKIIRDPYVQTEFFAFLHNTFSEGKLAFWLEVEAFQDASNTSLTVKQSKAAAIYERFLKDPSSVGILTVDVTEVAKVLKMKQGCDGSWTSNQTDENVLLRAFNYLAAKIFAELKFEYMASFLISERFHKLGVHKEYFRNIDDAASKAVDVMNGMNMSFILTHPLGYHHFLHFCWRTNEVVGPKNAGVGAEAFPGHLGVDMVHLRLEIEDFLHAQPDDSVTQRLSSKVAMHVIGSASDLKLDPSGRSALKQGSHRLERLKRIIMRYAQLSSYLRSLEGVVSRGTARAPNFEKLSESFRAVMREIDAFLGDNFLQAFKNTTEFATMSTDIALPSEETCEESTEKKALMARSFRVKATQKNVEQIRTFSENRNLCETKEMVERELETLKGCLDSIQGRLHFKRFCCNIHPRLQSLEVVGASLVEELILFWLECEEFQNRVYDNTNIGTAIYKRPGETECELRKRRAEIIRDKYIVEGSRMQINIDNEMRERCCKLAEINADEFIFAETMGEVFTILNQHVWPLFKGSRIHSVLYRKTSEKATMRILSGAVHTNNTRRD